MSEQTPNEKVTSADLKKQIEEATKTEKAKKSAKESSLPLTGMIAAEINASEPSTTVVTPKAESKPDPVTPAAETATAPKESGDFKEWAKKKGIDWTTDDSVLSALHKSDQEFHRKQAERKAQEKQVQQQPPYTPPSYAPPAPNYGYQPAYQIPQRQLVENIARQYNMTPEDVERLAAFNRDFFETAMKTERERQAQDMDSIRVENQKNSVFRELSSDPVFRKPEVAIEYHRVLEEMQDQDPHSFEKDPNAYRRAFDRTLQNIARRNLEGRPLQEGNPLNALPMTPPLTPPRSLGQGSGGGAYENENGIDAAQFGKLSVDEKRKVLERAGLIANY